MGNIDIGIDIATAISVILATIAFIWNSIRENRKNRKLERLEKQKDRNARLKEFKLEKTTEIIHFLNERFHQLLSINQKIDDVLNIPLKARENNHPKVELPKYIKRNLSIDYRQGKITKLCIPENMWISGLLEEIIIITCEMTNYLANHPYVRFLNDHAVSKSSNNLTNLYFELTRTTNHTGKDNRTILMKVKGIECNPTSFGFYLRKEIECRKYRKLTEYVGIRIGDISKELNEKDKDRRIENICVEEYLRLGKSAQADIYVRYTINQLNLLCSLRKEWLVALKRTKESIREFSDYSYRTLVK